MASTAATAPSRSSTSETRAVVTASAGCTVTASAPSTICRGTASAVVTANRDVADPDPSDVQDLGSTLSACER